jgi:hypothetical protein
MFYAFKNLSFVTTFIRLQNQKQKNQQKQKTKLA